MRYVIILFIIAIFIFLGVLIFGHNSGGRKPIVATAKSLPEYANTDVDMSVIIDGSINGDEAHRQIVITVGQNQRTLQINKGYQGSVLKSESFGNNSDAYSAFLHALSLSGFTVSRPSKFADQQGQCPFGQRYNYQIIDNGNKKMNTWSTSCNTNGSFKGQGPTVRSIFQNQFANYSNYTSDVSL